MSIPIIGVGASTGGLKEFEQLLKYLPNDLRAAIVIIQHLSAEHNSLLPGILDRYTKRHVLSIEDGMPLKEKHVYVIPPQKAILLKENKLHLIPLDRAQGKQLPLDTFFESLAQERGTQAMGVILCGMGDDGTAGAKAIQDAGGVVFAQAVDTTAYSEMPRNAIQSGMVDLSLPVSAIPRALLNYIQHGRKPPAIDEELLHEKDEQIYAILNLLQAETGQDFSNYKRSTIERRIKRRIIARHLKSLEDYQTLLKENREELEDLQKELLVSVTSFFRDPEMFEYAYENTIPSIVDNIGAHGDDIRIWIAGCATGEEAYTWAMLFQSYLEENKSTAKLRIFATDADKQAIRKARSGFYHLDAVNNIPEAYIEKFFEAQKTGYRINKQLRDKIIFAVQNLVQDPPYSQLDLLSCRNLLIYFNLDLQKHANNIFHYALKKQGYLVLGNAESLSQNKAAFDLQDQKFKIYRKKANGQPAERFWSLPSSSITDSSESPKKNWLRKGKQTLGGRVQNFILKNYAPPSIVINRSREILYVQGNMGDYLELTTGEMSNHIIQVARPKLKWALSNAIRVAFNKGERTVSNNVYLGDSEAKEKQFVDIVIAPLKREAEPAEWIISFKENAKTTAFEQDASYPSPFNLYELEKELDAKERHLQNTIEQLEAANEELKSANEEAQSTNEELQSSNEELKVSKEQAQSINKELNNSNTELNAKIEELNRVTSTLNNLLTSTDIATVFLDRDLKIFRFTPAISNIINLLESDIGRSIRQFTNKLLDEGWLDEVQDVLENLESKEIEVQTSDERYFWMRILPYYTLKNTVDGVVTTFTEITEKKKQEIELERYRNHLEDLVEEQNQALKQREQRFKQITEITTDFAFGYILHGQNLHQCLWSYGDFKIITGYDKPESPLKFLQSLMPPKELKRFEEKQSQLSKGISYILEHRIETAEGNIKWIQLKAVPDNPKTAESIFEVVYALKDISKRKERSETIRINEKLLQRTERIAHVGSWQMLVNPPRPQNWSEEVYRIFGLDIQDAPPSFEEIMSFIAAADVEKTRNAIQEAQKERKSFNLEIAINRPSGEVRHCVLMGHPKYSAQGDIEYIYGSFQDITARKKIEQALQVSEQKFRNIVNNVPGLVLKYQLNPDSSEAILYLSRGVEDLYEISRQQAIQDISLLWHRIHPDDLEEHRASIDKSAKELSFWEREYRLLMPDGRIKWVHGRGIPMKAENGSIVWDTLGVEISKQKKAQKELEEREASLKKLNATKDKLFSIIGHDLKGPLSNIIGLAELIKMNQQDTKEEQNTDEILQLSQHMHQSAKKLARLLDNLLTWSRSQMDKIYCKPENFRLRLAVDNCIELLRPQADKKRIQLHNEIPEQYEAFGDPDMVVVVIRNLLSNAVKFTFPKGKVRIHSKPEGETISIGVSDSGMGIPEELLQKIMSSDGQVTTQGTNGEKGTGLGLSICKDFIQKNKGRFWIESQEGLGSTFYFSLLKAKETNRPQ